MKQAGNDIFQPEWKKLERGKKMKEINKKGLWVLPHAVCPTATLLQELHLLAKAKPHHRTFTFANCFCFSRKEWGGKKKSMKKAHKNPISLLLKWLEMASVPLGCFTPRYTLSTRSVTSYLRRKALGRFSLMVTWEMS